MHRCCGAATHAGCGKRDSDKGGRACVSCVCIYLCIYLYNLGMHGMFGHDRAIFIRGDNLQGKAVGGAAVHGELLGACDNKSARVSLSCDRGLVFISSNRKSGVSQQTHAGLPRPAREVNNVLTEITPPPPLRQCTLGSHLLDPRKPLTVLVQPRPELSSYSPPPTASAHDDFHTPHTPAHARLRRLAKNRRPRWV